MCFQFTVGWIHRPRTCGYESQADCTWLHEEAFPASLYQGLSLPLLHSHIPHLYRVTQHFLACVTDQDPSHHIFGSPFAWHMWTFPVVHSLPPRHLSPWWWAGKCSTIGILKRKSSNVQNFLNSMISIPHHGQVQSTNMTSLDLGKPCAVMHYSTLQNAHHTLKWWK
jgi:hypothetical protein